MKKNPFIATDEANTISLMGGQRLLTIEDPSSFTADSLVHFLDNKKSDALLLIRAGNLPKNSPLRQEAEQNPFVLAFACYEPTELEQQNNIRTILTKAGKKISTDALKYLTQKISSHAGIVDQELDKLLIFLGEESTVSIKAIDEIITDSADVSEDQFCVNVASGQTKKVEKALQALSYQKDSVSGFVYALINYFTTLSKLVENKQSVENQTKILSKDLKPSQFKIKDPLLAQSRKWSPLAANKALHEFRKLESLTRQTGVPEITVFSNTCLKITEFARKLNGLG